MNSLNQLKQDFSEKQNSFSEMMADIKNQITRTILTKGYPENTFPYSYELSGGGKLKYEEISEIPPKTMSSNYFRINYNSKNQIILSEQWSFGIFRYLSMTFYEANGIKCFNWEIPHNEENDEYKLSSVSLLEIENNKAIKSYIYSPNNMHTRTSEYIYENDLLINVVVKQSTIKEKYSLHYDKDKNLVQILRTILGDKSIQQIYPRVKWIKTDD